MAVEFGPLWRRKIRTLATRLDFNHDGVVTLQDFHDIVARYHEMSKQQPNAKSAEFEAAMQLCWDYFFKQTADENGGSVTPELYAASVQKQGKKRTEQICELIFQRFFDLIDTNNDGLIQPDEFYTYYQVVGMTDKKAAKDAFDAIDLDKDGLISREEYMKTVHEFFEGEEDSPAMIFWGPLVD